MKNDVHSHEHPEVDRLRSKKRNGTLGPETTVTIHPIVSELFIIIMKILSLVERCAGKEQEKKNRIVLNRYRVEKQGSFSSMLELSRSKKENDTSRFQITSLRTRL